MRHSGIETVEWVDSTTHNTGWVRPGDSELSSLSLKRIRSVGFVIDEDEDRIIMTGSFAQGDYFHNLFMIPKGCITSREKLKYDEPKTKKSSGA